MPLPIYRLRRVLIATALVITVAVAGMYFYARMRTRDFRKEIPNKLGINISKTANGFRISKSDGQRTLFSVEAADVKEFKLNGRAELHQVSIILYGRDSSRYDQIYGDDFGYDPKSGEVTARGEVQIDLVANPEGSTSPDQSAPKNVKNTIHLKTRDLVFNKNTGDAFTNARVEFSTPQARGWAVGAKYAGKSNVLTLSSQIHMQISGPNAAVIDADHGEMTNDPRQIVLDHPHLKRPGSIMQSDQAVLHLSSDNDVENVVASGNVRTQTNLNAAEEHAGAHPYGAPPPAREEIYTRADQADLLLAGNQNLLRTVTLSGNVHVDQIGSHPIQGDAGRLILQFVGQNRLQNVRATDGARLIQGAVSGRSAAALPTAQSAKTSGPQNFQLAAPTIDFRVVDGRLLQFAETSGAPTITIAPATDGISSAHPSSSAGQTVITAGKFQANFATENGRTYPVAMHGAPNARIVNTAPDQPDRVSTSDSVDAVFLPQGGVESVIQKGNVVYNDNQPPDKRMQAWAANARYTPSDQLLTLTGNPRVESGSMLTTAKTIHINRATGQAGADSDVKSTYNQLKAQPTGALLASSSPIHVTARSMTALNKPGVAVYNGTARLWQDANVIEAPSIQFDRDNRSIIAQGTLANPVRTVLIQARKPGLKVDSDTESATAKTKQSLNAISKEGSTATDSGPITITADQLTYTDSERKAHYQGSVVAKGTDFTASSQTLDVYLRARGESDTRQSLATSGQLDRMVAQGDVLVQEPNRHAEGQKLVYTAADDKFVLTGGPPSIFDAEQGKITGVSLTFFRRDDRVLVEGEASSPVVTETRVAR